MSNSVVLQLPGSAVGGSGPGIGSGFGVGVLGIPPGGAGGGAGKDTPCRLNPGDTACVTPETLIALFPNGWKPARMLAVGDVLLTLTQDGEYAGEEITSLFASSQPCLTIEVENSLALCCSLSHEIMVFDPDAPQGRKVRVSELTDKDRLLNDGGCPVSVNAITSSGVKEVIRLSLAGPHHTYLSGGLWSHNKVTPV